MIKLAAFSPLSHRLFVCIQSTKRDNYLFRTSIENDKHQTLPIFPMHFSSIYSSEIVITFIACYGYISSSVILHPVWNSSSKSAFYTVHCTLQDIAFRIHREIDTMQSSVMRRINWTYSAYKRRWLQLMRCTECVIGERLVFANLIRKFDEIVNNQPDARSHFSPMRCQWSRWGKVKE